MESANWMDSLLPGIFLGWWKRIPTSPCTKQSEHKSIYAAAQGCFCAWDAISAFCHYSVFLSSLVWKRRGCIGQSNEEVSRQLVGMALRASLRDACPSGCTNVLTHDSTLPRTGAMQIRSSLLKPISRRAEEAAPSAAYSFRLPGGET